MTATTRITKGIRTVANDIAQGFFEITHNGFALLGLAVMFAIITLVAHPEIRTESEVRLMGWLQDRHAPTASVNLEPEAIERATATNPQELPKQQAAVAFWLSKKYGVAPEPLSALVAEAFETGRRAKVDPTLILAVMSKVLVELCHNAVVLVNLCFQEFCSMQQFIAFSSNR